jgi:hypothetical protein
MRTNHDTAEALPDLKRSAEFNDASGAKFAG